MEAQRGVDGPGKESRVWRRGDQGLEKNLATFDSQQLTTLGPFAIRIPIHSVFSSTGLFLLTEIL